MKDILYNRIILFAFILFLYGCMAPVRTYVSIETDEFEPAIKFLGIPERASGGSFWDSYYFKYYLRSYVDKSSKEVIHQLYVEHSYSNNWRFVNQAFLTGGISLELVDIDSDVSCGSYSCTYKEIFGITIPDTYLRNNTGGFSIKISTKSGHSYIIPVTVQQINEQLTAIDSIM